ncbi:pyridine nucleotide-disulfide oxidoreductase [Halarchaeum grantii]|uniref:Pyridine nucleotide-disulfide oxidoreductase n=1 Tax=Halarchaeum grantii TaxID=1193105 RepID=A0A830EWV6_9EURY|nr:NAD(P)/FAD-dependent oxidoreductase [Halarchaeum grantii]GGL38647.1 pyridine nucleotide-disulfide oxidoreductase [Halarchaeum grantii]
MTDRPHVVVLGAYGSAGAAAASELAEMDVRLTLVDDGDPGGGLCILRGCMPSKAVLSATAHRYQARHDPRLDGAAPEVNLERTVAHKDDHVLDWAASRRESIHGLAEREHVEFVHDTGHLVDAHTVRVGGRDLDADYVVVATGSSLNVPDVPGLDAADWMGSADVLDATEFPDSGVVMGFGYVGLELVPYLSEAAGMDLTVIEHDARPLDRAADRLGDELLACYREDFGVEIRTEVREESVERTGDGGVRVRLDDGSDVEADQLFLFTGRRPNVRGIGLGNAGIDVGAGDWVDTATMRCRDAPTVFVAGDALGERMLLHHSKEEGSTVAENVRRAVAGERLTEYDPIHHEVAFAGASVYPYASLGLTAEEARRAGHEVVVASRDATDDGIFKLKEVRWGHARLVVDADDGTVLGYHGLHYEADVMAKTMQVVLENELDVRDVPERAYHPTTPEILDGLVRDARAELD